MVQIFEPEKDLWSFLGQDVPRHMETIANTIGNYQQKKKQKALIDQLSQPNPELAALLGTQKAENFPQAISAYSNLQKAQTANQVAQHKSNLSPEDEAVKPHVVRAFQSMKDLLKSQATGVGAFEPGTVLGINRKGVENRSYWNGLRAGIESGLLPLVSKGALTKTRFDYIMSNIPKASMTHREIKGKLKALGKEFGIDTSDIDDLFEEDSSEKKSDQLKEGQTFSSLPPASSHKNAIFKLPSGKRVKSNGTSWVPA